MPPGQNHAEWDDQHHDLWCVCVMGGVRVRVRVRVRARVRVS